MAGRGAGAPAGRRARAAAAARGRGPALVRAGWKGAPPPAGGFPWSAPALRALDAGLALDAPVTFLVGENGSGKSTLLEALALAADARAVGSERDPWRDPTLAPQRALARERAAAGAGDRDHADGDVDPSLHADGRAAADLVGRYDARSHGESFLDYFTAHLDAPGLYLLDEPEAPLSPQRQLALLALLADAARGGAQLVVATHSPILLALPGARIYALDDRGARETPYDALEHVRVTRDFLNAPERYLRHLA